MKLQGVHLDLMINVAQCENLPDHCLGSAPALPERQIVPQAEARGSDSGRSSDVDALT
jgi:antirestriction protein ArdC